MTKREKIREGTQHLFCQHCKAIQKVMGVVADCWYNPLDREAPAFCASNEDFITQHFKDMDSQGVAIKVDKVLPYQWGEFARKHSYRPFKEFTTYTLKNRFGKMFGYIQKYQSLTGYKCFDEPVRFCIYLGSEEWAHSDRSFPTLRRAKENLLEQFLSSRDNPDNEIPEGYVAVEPIIEEVINDHSPS